MAKVPNPPRVNRMSTLGNTPVHVGTGQRVDARMRGRLELQRPSDCGLEPDGTGDLVGPERTVAEGPEERLGCANQ